MVSSHVFCGVSKEQLTLLLQSKIVDDDPLSWIGFEEDCIVTACAQGHVRLWDRPQEGVNGSQTDLTGPTSDS